MSSFCVLSDREVNTVADRVPEEGLNWSFVEDTFTVSTVPDVMFSNIGYLTAFVEVSSLIVTAAAEGVEADQLTPAPVEIRTLPATPTLL
jgi:hypothetical protein